MIKETSAGAIIFRKDKYLILHYEKDYWGFAKGKLEKGETEKEAAIREIREETGIKDIKFIKGYKEEEKYFYKNKKGQLINKKVIFFLAESKKDKVKISWEHKGYKWLKFEDAMKILKFKNHKELLKKANLARISLSKNT